MLFRSLVAPRVIACPIMTPVLTIFSDVVGCTGAWAIIVKGHGVPGDEYWHHTARFLLALDPFNGLIKAACFGTLIGVVSCWKGFTCGPGAAGVGRAATSAFVASFIAIVASNLVLVELLNALTRLIHGRLPTAL